MITTQHARQVALFLALAFAGAWLVASPLWISGLGLETPGAIIFIVLMMFTPALAAWLTERIIPSGAKFTTVTSLRPTRPFRAWAPYAALAWFGPLLVMVAALALAVAFGVFRVDLVNFSGFAETLSSLTGGAELPMPVQALVAVQLVTLLFAPIVNVIPAMGEELGWRGYLQPKLLPLGQWRAVLLTGVAWGLWHAPVILLGYNYPGYQPFVALGLMVVFTTLLSILVGWLTIASGTVWVAGIAHGFVNGVAGLGALVVAAGTTIDAGAVGLTGYTGWLVMAALVLVLVLSRRFPVKSPQAVRTAPGAGSPTAQR